MTIAAPLGRGRILELDALRGIAALGVVVWHYGVHFQARPLGILLLPFYNAGFLLVDFFFVLSGYVVARAYWNQERSTRLWRNAWARVARMYPLHLATLLATVILLGTMPPVENALGLEGQSNDVKHFVLNLLLLNQVGLQDGWSFNTPAWSISTEFVVNLLFLAFIATPPPARRAVMAAGVAVGIAYFATVRPPLVAGDTAFGFLDVNLLRCGLGFAAGVTAFLGLHRLGLDRLRAAWPAISGLVGLGGLVATVLLLLSSTRHPPVRDYLASIVFASACVAFVPGSTLLASVLRWRPLVFLGEISYSTYLVHYPLQLALVSLAGHAAVEMDYASPLVMAGYLACVIGVATFSYHFVEIPWQARFLSVASRRKCPG